MAGMLNHRSPDMWVNLPVDPARFCPPDPEARGSELLDENDRPCGEHIGALAEWLFRITPPGAPVVPILNVSELRGPGCAPFLRGRVPLDRRPVGWPRARRDAEILALVPPGTTRPQRGEAPWPQQSRRRWHMEQALFHDIWGEKIHKVAGRIEAATADGWHGGRERSRTAERWISDGRAILSKLGAWPWCLSPAGRLPADWWREPRFAEELATWHRESFVAMVGDALRASQYAAGDRSDMRYAPGNREAALQLYRQQFP
ncbi:MAG: hypothetical protein ACR2LK_12710 [Solirubrobacteraceae bacterium]